MAVFRSVRIRILAGVGALGIVVLPAFAQEVGEISACFASCHERAMEIEDEMHGPDWEEANEFFFDCLEEECGH